MKFHIAIAGAIALLFWGIGPDAFAKGNEAVVQISREGEALLPIVISSGSSVEVQKVAKELAQALNRITGGEFAIESKNEPLGIILGTEQEWPNILPPVALDRSPLLCREEYTLKTQDGNLFLIGRTPGAVRNAVWDLLFRIGFRQFFPGETWAIWPNLPSLSIALNSYQSPSYLTRGLRVGNEGLNWKKNQEDGQQWKERNRMISGFSLKTGHAYEAIIHRNSEEFKAHPEYLSSENKIDSSHDGVLALVAADAVRHLTRHPGNDSVSMEPSDGGGWRNDSPLGSPSNQVVTLANYVALAVQEKFPGRKVGIYAYNEHSLPPDIEVDPNVVVSVSTAFIRGGYTAEGIMSGWRKKGATFGVREYLGVAAWDHALPGRSKASDLDYLASTIPRFHQLGARYWEAEVTETWAANGLGFYLASRLLWDTREVDRLPELLADFYDKSFEKAAPEMRHFFENYLLKTGHPLLSEDLVGRMYRSLSNALQKEKSPEVTARIKDFVIYTRYVELMLAYNNSGDSEKRTAFDEVARFAYRVRNSGMIDRWTVFREIPQRDFKVPNDQITQFGESIVISLNEKETLNNEELIDMLKSGIENNLPNDFAPVSFSSKLRPLRLKIGNNNNSKTPPKKRSITLRGTNRLILHANNQRGKFEFSISGGQIYGNRGPVHLRLYSGAHVIVDEPVATAEVPVDKQSHEIKLESPYTGMHVLEVSDGGDATIISWPEGQQTVLQTSPEESVNINGRYSMVFYVPEKTKVVGGFSSSSVGRIRTEQGQIVFDFQSMAKPGYFSVPVPKGQNGACWWLEDVSGKMLLMTVPPYLARMPAELLVPEGATGKSF